MPVLTGLYVNKSVKRSGAVLPEEALRLLVYYEAKKKTGGQR